MPFLFIWAKFSKLLSSPSGVLYPFQVKCALVIKLLPGKFVSTDVCGKFLVVCLVCLLGVLFVCFNQIQIFLTIFIKVDAFSLPV